MNLSIKSLVEDIHTRYIFEYQCEHTLFSLESGNWKSVSEFVWIDAKTLGYKKLSSNNKFC